MMAIFLLSAQGVVLLRAYAFTGRKYSILVLLSTLFVVMSVAEIWLFGTRFVMVDGLYILLGHSGCFANDETAEIGDIYLGATATPAGLVFLGSFIMDVIMMLIVIAHTLRIQSTQGSLGKLFIAQGLGTFAFMSTLHLFSAIIYLRSDRQYDGIGLPLTLVSDVLACRLILALRRQVAPTTSQLSMLQSRLVREALAHLEAEPPPENVAPQNADHCLV